jgi:hypothetical protein
MKIITKRKYEYYIIRDDKFVNAEMSAKLDKFDEDGWELIAVTPINANGDTVWVNYTIRRLLK